MASRPLVSDPEETTVVTTVRLLTELRDELAKHAAANQRSLSAEIVKRLRDSLDAEALGFKPAEFRKQVQAETATRNQLTAGTSYAVPQASVMLALFERMSTERQLALLTLLRD